MEGEREREREAWEEEAWEELEAWEEGVEWVEWEVVMEDGVGFE